MAEIRLESISVYGFKSIRALENFEIRPLNVLIGANGAGKSNFISLFRLLQAINEKHLAAYSAIIGADRLMYYGRKETELIKLRLDFASSNKAEDVPKRYELELIPTLDGQLAISNEILWHSEDLSSFINGVRAEAKMFSDNGEFLEYSATLSGINNWKIYHFHDTSETSKMKGRQDLHDNRYLKSDASNLAPFLYYLQQVHPEYYRRIVQAIQQVAPFFDDFILQPLRLAKEEIRLEWRDKSGTDTVFTAHELSDGTLRFICLATLLLQPELPNLILIDEPELGLHPFAINLLADLLEIASHKTQVIVSTQSVPLVNQFSPEQVVVVDRRDGQSTFERPNSDALSGWLEDYGLGDLWEKNVIGGRPQAEIKV